MNTNESFDALPLAAPLQRALSELNYTQPSPIQAAAIPHVLAGHDLLATAQTGTGKTAAFALPVLHRLDEKHVPLSRGQTRALVLTPTRELAVQVGESFDKYGRHTDLIGALVYGGVSMSPQIRALKDGVDVLIATPGRLIDLIQQGQVKLDAVECLVLDEADRMLDMGFINDIRKIVAKLPRARQSLFFSATISPAIAQLAGDILVDPVSVRVEPEQVTAEKVDHRICFVQHDQRADLLGALLEEQERKEGQNLTLVFSRTKHGADRIARQLNKSDKQKRADSIHGNKSQAQRQRALDRFRSGRVPVLVATDVAARGIDVKDVTLVINYDLPDEPEAYVHRIGRTARAGAQGTALSFCTAHTLKELHAVEKLIRQEIAVHAEHAYHDASTASKRLGQNRSTSNSARKSFSKSHRNSRSRPNGGKRKFASAKGGAPGGKFARRNHR